MKFLSLISSARLLPKSGPPLPEADNLSLHTKGAPRPRKGTIPPLLSQFIPTTLFSSGEADRGL
jgi:hypothetical protein